MHTQCRICVLGLCKQFLKTRWSINGSNYCYILSHWLTLYHAKATIMQIWCLLHYWVWGGKKLKWAPPVVFTHFDWVRIHQSWVYLHPSHPYTLESPSWFQIHFPTSGSWPSNLTPFLSNPELWLNLSWFHPHMFHHKWLSEIFTRDNNKKRKQKQKFWSSLPSQRRKDRLFNGWKTSYRRVCTIKSNLH